MKKLYVIRHAKSSWSDLSLRDIERPLNKRGKRDAPFMGDLLQKEGVVVDLILSSPAVRAKTTAQLIAKAIGYPTEQIGLRPVLYGADTDEILALIHTVEASVTTLMIFGHNPAFTEFANLFSPDTYIANVPTCGIIQIIFDIDNWHDAAPTTGKMVNFDYPKKHLSS